MEPLSRIAQAGRHLLLLINDLLDLSKIEAGKMELQEVELDVEAMVIEAAATAVPLAGRNGNQIVVDCAPDIGLMRGDRTRINHSACACPPECRARNLTGIGAQKLYFCTVALTGELTHVVVSVWWVEGGRGPRPLGGHAL